MAFKRFFEPFVWARKVFVATSAVSTASKRALETAIIGISNLDAPGVSYQGIHIIRGQSA